jgi:chromosome partitioning protein
METTATPEQTAPYHKAHIIIVGNEKGGCGKTTTTMHLIVALLRLGFSVGCIDLDSRQRSLTRYVENRRQTVAKEGTSLPMPRHAVVNKSPFDSHEEAKKDERERFAQSLSTMYGTNDFVVIDTPGNDTYLSRLAHSFADTIITPINDSFVDLDVLASVDGRTLEIVKPSIYSEIVWEQKLQRAKRDGGSIDWIVMRNRLSNIDAKNKRFMAKVTLELARRIGFRAAPGFSERVIFRELFLQGLTVLDVMEAANVKISMSHIAARQEVRDLLKTLNIDIIHQRIEKLRKEEEAKGIKEPEIREDVASASDEDGDGDGTLPSVMVAEDTTTPEVSTPPSAPSAEPAPKEESVFFPSANETFSFSSLRTGESDTGKSDTLKDAAAGFRAPALASAH